ncbi:HAD family phosphatase [Candidatus Woesearchaeota archaeon]|nr:HAD family phosphatase [Candidatus Woesearchaeota archaeon]
MIKGLVFDFGGILTDPSTRLGAFCLDYASKQGLDSQAFRTTFLQGWSEARVGDISMDAFWQNVASEFSQSPSRLRSEFLNYFKINEQAFNFIKSLRKRYKIAILTNIIKDLFDYLDEKYFFTKYFNSIVLSYKMRTAKPDTAMYKEAVKELGLLADECLYVDDMKENLTPAQKIGMHTIHFKDLNSLKTELMMFGIKTV